MSATDSFNPLRTIRVGTVATDDGTVAVTADRYEDDPPVVAILDPESVAHEYTPDVARALGQLLITAADTAHAWTAVPS